MSKWHVNIVSIFPSIFDSFISTSLIAKAVADNVISIDIFNPRDFAVAPHLKVDDSPYGGGPGMVMKPEPLVHTIEFIKARDRETRTILLSPGAPVFKQNDAKRISNYSSVTFVCGRYEGIDQRVSILSIDESLSIGEYILMGGEVPTMVCIEACARLIPGVIGNSQSLLEESYSSNSISEYPHFTKPRTYRGLEVPEVLLSGNHKDITTWRKKYSK
jgi:tRNA (guanine37-N1)-methyltransferase